MTKVSVSELKSRLSRYLREVRRGGEVQILDRGRPIARLTGLAGVPAESEERLHRLIQSGVVRPGGGNVLQVVQAAPLELSTSLSLALDEERTDRL